MKNNLSSNVESTSTRRNSAWTLAGVVVVLAVLLGGCSTMAGIGQDVQKGGEAIERGATKNR